jgi:hypothetical protein
MPHDLVPDRNMHGETQGAQKLQLARDKTRIIRLKTSGRLATFKMYEGVSLNLKT